MKCLGIIWGPAIPFCDDICKTIKQEGGTVSEVFDIDLTPIADEFLPKLYKHTNPEEQWKVLRKSSIVKDKCGKTHVAFVFYDFFPRNIIFLERKHVYVWEELDNLKKTIRSKYSQFIPEYAFDNVFHSTDDEEEYDDTLALISEYRDFFAKQIAEQNLVLSSKTFPGKRDKNWFLDGLFMKKLSKNYSFETAGEIFYDYVGKHFTGLETVEYFSDEEGRSLTCENFVKWPEILLEGETLLSVYANHLEDHDEISEIETFSTAPQPIDKVMQYNNVIDIYNLVDKLTFVKTESKKSLKESILKLFITDAVCFQSDRNPYNWAFLYNPETTEMRLAPSYDNTHTCSANDPEAYGGRMPRRHFELLLHYRRGIPYGVDYDISSDAPPEIVDVVLKNRLDLLTNIDEIVSKVDIPENFKQVIIQHLKNGI